MFKVKYRLIYVLLLTIYSYFNILFTGADDLLSFEVRTSVLVIIIFIEILLIWEGNRLFQKYLHKRKRNYKRNYQPLIILFLLSVVNVFLITSILVISLNSIINLGPESLGQHIKMLFGFGFRVNLFLNSINAIIYYVNLSKESQLEVENFKKISIEAQFEALRNQINPHFLFNSLNVLSTLIYKNPDTANEFIEQLSKVYRYLIFNQDKKVIKLQSELEFINSYIYLLNIRFKDNLLITNHLNGSLTEYMIAPATLQLLIENAIKHNIVSQKHPLKIDIYTENDYLVVSNNLQKKNETIESTRIGLTNIKKRYQFLSNKEIQIITEDQMFSVKVPLIKMAEI